jgi:uncharacterized protein YjbI with pentapeptide repeats
MTFDLAALERQADFADATFAGLEARERRFADKELVNCTFTGAQLAGAAFVRCKLIDCVFKASDLSNVKLTGSTLRDVTFEETKLLGVDWTDLAAASHLAFRRAVLSMGNLRGVDARKWVLDHCVARELELAHANLPEADLRGTDFAGARFLQTNLAKADLRGALNYALRPADNVLKKARFSMPEATTLLYGLDIVLEE